MEVLLGAVAELAGTEATPENAEELIEEFGPAARMLGAVIRHTTNPTMLDAGYKVNVVPGDATAQVDGRFLPGLRGRLPRHAARAGRPGRRHRAASPRWPASRRRTTGTMADAMTASLLEEDPDALVAPYLMSGGTDAKHFTQLGMRVLRLRAAAAARGPRLHRALPRRRRAGAGGRARVRRPGLRHGSSGGSDSGGSDCGRRYQTSTRNAIRWRMIRAAQLHPAGAVVGDAGPGPAPSRPARPAPRASGSPRCARAHGRGAAWRTRTPPRDAGPGAARSRRCFALLIAGHLLLVGRHVVEGRDDLGGQLALLDGQRLAQLGGGAGADDRRGDARAGRAPRPAPPRAGTSRGRRRPGRRPRRPAGERSSR